MLTLIRSLHAELKNAYGITHMVRELRDINFVAYDMVEVLPAFDQTQITAFLGANVIFEFISIIALQKKKAR